VGGDLLRLGLACLVAFNLRSVILAVPPVLPELRSDLGLSFSAAGSLSSLPILCLSAAAVPGALLVNRFGARNVVGFGVLGLGAGAAARLLTPPLVALFGGTLLLAVSIAVTQPAAAVVLRAWFPAAVQRAATIYALGLNLGGLAGSSLTVYLLALGGWRGSFVIWSVPAALASLLWFWLAPRRRALEQEPSGLAQLLHEPEVWRAAGLFGSQSIAYFTAATWVPFLLRGYPAGYVALVLFLMGVALVPVSLALTVVRRPYAVSRAFYLTAGVIALAGAGGFASGLRDQAWIFAILVGIGSGLTFTGAMSLPSIVGGSETRVAGYSALMLTAGYALSFPGPLVGGFLLDRTGLLTATFWPVVAAGAGMLLLGATMPRRAAA
jgi:CP family cyanate transporter-like MFS transporter